MTRARQVGLIVCIGLLAAGIGLWAGSSRLQEAPPADDAVAQMFAQTYPNADGKPQPMAQWKGRVLVVNFWATWCPPCVEEMPDLQKIRDEYRARGVEIVGIGIDNEAKIRAFRDQYRLTLPLLVAGFEGSSLAQALGNKAGALPYTALVDRSGHVVQRKLGQIRPAELRAWLDAQLR